jgi:hypothetical protein
MEKDKAENWQAQRDLSSQLERAGPVRVSAAEVHQAAQRASQERVLEAAQCQLATMTEPTGQK